MIKLIEFALILGIFLPVKYLTYWLTEVKGLPEWLNYKPWICNLCLTFWSLLAIYIAIGVSFSCLITGIGGVIFAILNAIAMWIGQRQKTITLDDWEGIKDKTR